MATLLERPGTSSLPSFHTLFASPFGNLFLTSDGDSLTGLRFREPKSGRDPSVSARQDDGPFREVRRQLRAYFEGELMDFNIPLVMSGTPFQRRVWEELRAIPFGSTISYAELARRVGNPAASRAVGSANGRNPISIIVPCHRVIASDGSLGGFGGGLELKEWLLQLEAGARRRTSRTG